MNIRGRLDSNRRVVFSGGALGAREGIYESAVSGDRKPEGGGSLCSIPYNLEALCGGSRERTVSNGPLMFDHRGGSGGGDNDVLSDRGKKLSSFPGKKRCVLMGWCDGGIQRTNAT